MKQCRLIVKTHLALYKGYWQSAKNITIKEMRDSIARLNEYGFTAYYEWR